MFTSDIYHFSAVDGGGTGCRAAIAGDPVASGLMQHGADYLNAALDASGIAEDQAICLIGGTGPHHAPFLAPRYRERIRLANGSALNGAMQIARRKLEEMETPT